MSGRNAQSVFLEALEQESPEQLLQFLDQACSDDTALRSRLDELLRAHRSAGAFLGGMEPLHSETADLKVEDQSGKRVGPYKILQEIGEGGFGVVYMAEQSRPVERKVALKVIKPGMDSRVVIARFEAERQALALMDHPNIARVLDAGQTETQRPYFAMELVRGVAITEYADNNGLTTRDRLDLFVTVCRAVQHAHHKGIIHRDIKPSNVMVTLHDGAPVVKVIDFGVAKALNQKLTEKTLFTAYGQMIGTPQYMSPEQAEMSGLDVDTRSDVYSLGVLLYELLTGSTPLQAERLREAGYAEIQRLIREEGAPRLSIRLSTIGEELRVVAQHRSVEPNRLRQIMRGELDWIALRALEKERARRYESPGALLADIQRYLNNEAVAACPPSRAYLVKKFVSRHRGLVSAILAIMGALLVGLGIASYAFLRAEQETSRAKRVVEVLNAMLESADPSSGNATDYTVRAMLDEFAGTLDGRFDDDLSVEATVRHTIGRAYFYLGLPNVAEPHLRRALEVCDAHVDSGVLEAGILTDLAQTLMFTAGGRDNFAEPESMVRESIQIYRKHGEAKSELANSLCILGWVLYFKTHSWHFAGRENEAETANREGIELLKNFTDRRSLTVKGKMCMGLSSELLRGDPEDLPEAAHYAEEAVKLLRANSPHDHFMGLALLDNGLCQLRLGDVDKAESSLREAKLVEERTSGTVSHDRLSALMAVMFRQGKFDEALALARSRSIPRGARLPPKFVDSEIAVGRLLLGLGDVERAEAQLTKTWEASLAHLAEEHPVAMEAAHWLAQILANRKGTAKLAQARERFASLLPTARAHAGTHEILAHRYVSIVGHLESPASDDVTRAIEVNRRVLEEPLLSMIRIRNLYVGALVNERAGNREGAAAYLRQIIESTTAYDWAPMYAGEPFITLRNAEDHLVRMLLDSRDEMAAEHVYRDAVIRRKKADCPDRYQIVFAQQRLGWFLLEQGKQEQAHEILMMAQEALTDAPACFDWLAARIRDDLNRVLAR